MIGVSINNFPNFIFSRHTNCFISQVTSIHVLLFCFFLDTKYSKEAINFNNMGFSENTFLINKNGPDYLHYT